MMLKKYRILWLVVLIPFLSYGQDSTLVKVGIKNLPPFIIKDGEGTYSGLCIDLWEKIASELEISYQYVEYTDVLGMIRALDYNEIDISINPLNVTSIRLQMFDVSQPFFVSHTGIAASTSGSNQIWKFIINFFSINFFKVVILLLFVIFCFGILLWAFERRHNSKMFDSGLRGILDGLWWSAVTMTTVGYGDKAPKTPMGRTIAMIWMFTAIIIISGFTASISSALTVSSLETKIDRLEDLESIEKIGTVGSSVSEDFLLLNGVKPDKTYNNLLQSLKGLAKRETDVIVYDKAVMQYMIEANELSERIEILPINLNKQYRSFLFPKNSELIEAVNPVLVNVISQQFWKDIIHKYNLLDDH